MTFVMSLLNRNWAVQLSDRRLTSGHRPATDEYNKATAVITRDVRLLMGLSGLATIGPINSASRTGTRFDLSRTVSEILLDVADPDYRWLGIAERLTERLSEVFNRSPIRDIPESHRRCDLHFVGFVGADPPTPISTFVSSFHDPHTGEAAATIWKKFHHSTGTLAPDGLMAQALGTHHHVTTEDVAPLTALMKEGRPPEAVVGKGA